MPQCSLLSNHRFCFTNAIYWPQSEWIILSETDCRSRRSRSQPRSVDRSETLPLPCSFLLIPLFPLFVLPSVFKAAEACDYPPETIENIQLACLLRQLVRLQEPVLPSSSTLEELSFFGRHSLHNSRHDVVKTVVFFEMCEDFLSNWGLCMNLQISPSVTSAFSFVAKLAYGGLSRSMLSRCRRIFEMTRSAWSAWKAFGSWPPSYSYLGQRVSLYTALENCSKFNVEERASS